MNDETVQVHALGLSASLDDVICAEWISEQEVPPPRRLLYRDIPQDELDALVAKISDSAEDMAEDGSAQPTDKHAAQALTKLSDLDLLA